MSSSSPTRGPARETRLLILTLCVSVAVLFLLARFRFPARPISDLATPQPLARLARTTTFDDLSGTLTELLRRAGDASVTLQVSGADADADGGASAAARAGLGGRAAASRSSVDGAGASGASWFVPALRVRDDLALAVLPGDARVEAIDGAAVSGSPSASPVVARDEVRGLVLIRVPARPLPAISVQPQGEALELPGFVSVMEGAPGGPTMRAEFVSRVSTRAHPAWDMTVIVLGLGGSAHVRPGAMVFTLAGRLLGMVLPDDAETIVAPGDALIARADRLARGESVLAANAGLAVQPLSPALAKATKASNGVVIAAIEGAATSTGGGAGTSATSAASAGAAAAGAALRVGDVIAAIDNEPIGSVADWERLVNRRAPGTTVRLQVVRRDGTQQIPLTLKWRDAPLAPGDDGAAAAAASVRRNDTAAGALGLALRALPSANGNSASLEVQRVSPGSAAARAGLQIGDRITALPYAAAAAAAASGPRAGSASALVPAPAAAPLTAARVEAAFKALASGDALILAINRGGQPLVVAIEKP
jgi:hypothetical protein